MGDKKEEESDIFSVVRGLQRRTGVNVALFCDDIESAMLSSEHIQMPEYLAKSSALLNKLQGVGSGNFLLSGSTNNPFVMDSRFLEFGRIGYVLHVPLPDEKNRKETFLVHTKGKHIVDIDFSSLAAVTAGFSNRHIEEICRGAGDSAVKRAGASIMRPGESLFEAAKRVTPDVARDFPINSDDFAVGLEMVRKYIRIKEIRDLDSRIGEFCKSYSHEIGF
jgi:SpoVK/Ycf46/Vps4 family AAA+-type ATPase